MWVMYRKDWASGIWAKRVWQMGVANGCGSGSVANGVWRMWRMGLYENFHLPLLLILAELFPKEAAAKPRLQAETPLLLTAQHSRLFLWGGLNPPVGALEPRHDLLSQRRPTLVDETPLLEERAAEAAAA